MNEEEMKAMWYFGEVLVYENDMEQWKIIENLIYKLQKENKSTTYNFEKTVDKLEKAEKVIDLIVESWKQDDIRSVKEIKEYFYKKVEEENE